MCNANILSVILLNVFLVHISTIFFFRNSITTLFFFSVAQNSPKLMQWNRIMGRLMSAFYFGQVCPTWFKAQSRSPLTGAGRSFARATRTLSEIFRLLAADSPSPSDPTPPYTPVPAHHSSMFDDSPSPAWDIILPQDTILFLLLAIGRRATSVNWYL